MKYLRLLFILFVFNQAYADVKLPALFADHMVLQQDTTVKVWGWANPNEKVTITADWQKNPVMVTANKDGKWMVAIKTLKYDGKAHQLHFNASNQLDIHDILFGEVWICGGQSNMHFPLMKLPGHSWATGVINAKEVVAKANYPHLRFITIERNVSDTVKDDVKGQWLVCTPATASGDISAVSYFYALQIMKKTGFPVGLIGSNWGGTPAESWTSKTVLEHNKDFKPILERYAATVANWPTIRSQYITKIKAYRHQDSIAKANHTKRPSAPREPVGPNSNKSPYKLYNAMIVPLEPFTIKGVIWYQGENNAVRAYQYRELFPAMIKNWRDDWKNPNLPFYFVQISPHRSQNPVIRESQLYTFEHVKGTGMVVTTDNGDSLNIHPRNKELVGNRLSLWALKNLYGFKNIEASGPIYQSKKIEGDKVVITFSHDEGLMAKDGDLKEFTIAGEDHAFYPATAKIKGDKVTVYSSKVAHPAAVRFAWRNVPKPNLYNAAGLPASPFRTDDWRVETQGLN